MNAKQEAFVREYLIDLSVAEAADRAEYEWPTSASRFYVYFLIDADEIFYVGKGKGKRIKQHRARNQSCNHVKAARVEAAIQAGQYVEKVFADDLSEADALRLERAIIRELRESGLTNISSGMVHPLESQIARIDDCLARFRPFDDWCRVAPDYAYDFALKYHGSLRAAYDHMRAMFTELRDEYEAQLREANARA